MARLVSGLFDVASTGVQVEIIEEPSVMVGMHMVEVIEGMNLDP